MLIIFSRGNTPRIIIAGYGKVGQDMVGYLSTVPELVNVVGVVEPLEERGIAVREIGLPVYKNLEHAIDNLNPKLVIDCSTIGQGARNLEIYLQSGIPAILQGGEHPDTAPLYIPGKVKSTVVRIPKCSATITIAVLLGLLEKGIRPRYLEGYYYKTMPYVNEGKDWWGPEYKSSEEVAQTLETIIGEKLNIGRISSRYLPGEPLGKPMYSADLLMTIDPSLTENDVLAALNEYSGVAVVPSSELNKMPVLSIEIPPLQVNERHSVPLTYNGVPLVPVIDRNSIRRIPNSDVMMLHVEAVAPSIDLPINLMAVLELTHQN